MRKAAVLLLSTTAVLMVVGLVMVQSLLILQRVAAVEDVQGMVWVRQRGHEEFVPLADRPRVAAGDMIRTDPNGRVDLHYVDGTRMRIGPATRMTVLKSHHNAATQADVQTFKLDIGRVWIRVLKVLSQKSKFEVVTPTATAGVRGTIFAVEVKPDGETLVSVKEGKVAIGSGESRSEVEAGKMSRGAKIATLDASERALWEQNETVAGPHLEVKQPVDGSTVAVGEAVAISGVAEAGATVKINGQSQPLKLQKLFETTVTAPQKVGPFDITVEATDRRGLTTRRVIPLKVAASR